MAQSKKQWVRFKSGCKIPVGIVDKEKPIAVPKGKEIQLPEAYAQHMKSSGLADFCDAPKKSSAKKQPAKPAAPKPPATASAAANDDLAKAEKAVSDAEAALKAVAGTDGEGAARAALGTAKADPVALGSST